MSKLRSKSPPPEVEDILISPSTTKAAEASDLKAMAIKHVLQLLVLDDEAVDALYAAKINSLRRLILTRMDHLCMLASDSSVDLQLSDIDQIYFFKN